MKRMLKELLSQKFLLPEPKELQADVNSERREEYGAALRWNKLFLRHTFKMFGQVDKRREKKPMEDFFAFHVVYGW
jgi:hypothetical protein